MAADAYIKGWDGAGRHSVPVSSSADITWYSLTKQGSCPKPLREHLAMNFPSSVPLSSSTPKRPSYHARLVASAPTLSVLPESTELGTFDSRRHSFRQSQVRVSSPLCRQVDEEPVKSKQPNWAIGPNGLLSPPSSPDKAFTTSIVNRERPTARKSLTESGLWSSAPRRDFQRPTSLLSKSSSSSLNSNQPPSTTKASSRSSGLWTDSIPLPQPSSTEPTPDLASSAPKFSRSAMRKSGVVMPASAPRTNSSSSIRSRLSRTPSSTSISSLASSSSSHSLQTLRRPTITPKNSQDRLSTLTETSMRETRVDEHGMMAFGSLAPPRPSFMSRSNSSSSVSSTGSGQSISSMGSLTSASSACMSSLDSCSPIQEEDHSIQIRVQDNRLPITCTKSDADAASQSSADKKPKKGGLFKRLSRAFKKEKEVPAGQDANRRGSH